MAAHKKDWSEAIRLYESGLSLEDVAKFRGITRQALWAALRVRIKLRPQLRTGNDNHFNRKGNVSVDRCHNLFESALKRGIIQRKKDCVRCGTKERERGKAIIEAHHCDYEKPLEVMWLCRKCHFNWHKHNHAKNAEPLSQKRTH